MDISPPKLDRLRCSSVDKTGSQETWRTKNLSWEARAEDIRLIVGALKGEKSANGKFEL
jgi:hypothetical protein